MEGAEAGRRRWGEAAGAVRSPVRSAGETQFTLPCRQPGLTMEAPSVPVSDYKSGVTQSAEDNRPPHLIKRHRLLLRVEAAIDFTLTHSLVREHREAKAGSRLPRIIHPPSHKVSIVYSRILKKKKKKNDTIKLKRENSIFYLPFSLSLLSESHKIIINFQFL